jgi:predicted metal-dependent hydrolase
MRKYEVTYGNRTIVFSLERRNRRTMEIRVLPDMSVMVIAPDKADITDIKERVVKRGAWILKNKNFFLDFIPQEPPRKFVSGETHRYLGKQYRLKIIKNEKNEVKLKGQYITITSTKPEDRDHNKKLLYKWYRKYAVEKVNTMIDSHLIKLKKYSVSKPNIYIKKMKKRWGSCVAGKNKIYLNIETIRTPSYCIEYVIMHELCHLKHPNHDNNFYDFLTLVMPDWRERKERLEKVMLRR